jgi:hypothetical protein
MLSPDYPRNIAGAPEPVGRRIKWPRKDTDQKGYFLGGGYIDRLPHPKLALKMTFLAEIQVNVHGEARGSRQFQVKLIDRKSMRQYHLPLLGFG